MIDNQSYVTQIVEAWEDGYKKGLLTFWVLLALHNGPKHMRQIKQYIEIDSQSNLTVDEKSLYRSMSRFQKMDLLDSYKEQSDAGGPDFKVYRLTSVGREALQLFYQRNIKQVFLSDVFEKESRGL
jgi:DNA-binding PadR family transcriptional regulator